MIFGFDTSPCVVTLRSRSMFSSKMTSKWFALQNCLHKDLFLVFFSSFKQNFGNGNHRRLFSGNMPGMFNISVVSVCTVLRFFSIGIRYLNIIFLCKFFCKKLFYIQNSLNFNIGLLSYSNRIGFPHVLSVFIFVFVSK